MSNSQLTEVKINDLIRSYVRQTIKEMEIDRTTSREKLDSNSVDLELDIISDFKAGYRKALAYRDYHAVEESVNTLLKENGITLNKDSDDYLQLSHQMLKAQIFISDIDKKQALGDYTYQDQDYLTPSPAQP